MPLIDLVVVLVVLVVVGLLLWLAKRYIPMDPMMSNILTAVVVIAVVLFLLKAFRLLDSITAVTV